MSTLLRRVSVVCVILFALVWFAVQPTLRNVSAAPAAQEATPVAPQPTTVPLSGQDQGEIGVVDGRVGSVPIPNYALSVYARRPTGSVQVRNPFFYEVWPVVDYRSSKIFDADTNRLVFDLNIGKDIEPALLDAARKQVATGIGDGDPEDVVLLPLDLEAYELYLTGVKTRELLAIGQPIEGPFGPIIAVDAQIEDPALREALAKDPASLSLILRPFYRFKVFDIERARMEINQKVVAATLEKVLGETPTGKVLVTRDVLNKLKQEAITNVRLQVPADASGSLVAALERMEERFSTLPSLTLADLTSAQETLYYQVGNAQLEMTPQVLHELTTNWSSSEQFNQSFTQAWSNLHELARESNSAEEFYNQMHKQYKGASGGGFSFLAISADADFDLDLTWDEQSSEKRSNFEKFYEKAQNEGSISEETLKNIAESFTGLRDLTNVTAKDLKIYRVSDADLQSRLSLVTEQLKELPNILDSRTRTLKLINPRTVVNDAVFVDQEGKVGIGTTDPQTILDVNGRATLRPGDNPNGAGIYFNGTGDSTQTSRAFVGMESNDIFRIWGTPMNANGLTMNVTNGNVGIGAANSPAHFAVAGPGNQSVDISSTDPGSDSHLSILAVTSNGVTESQVQFNKLLTFAAPIDGSDGIMSLNEDGTVAVYRYFKALGDATVSGKATFLSEASVTGGLTVSGEIQGKLRYTSEYTVDSGQDPIQMIDSRTGFCFLTYVRGYFGYDSRSAHVYIGEDGYWYLDAGPNSVWAGARCAG